MNSTPGDTVRWYQRHRAEIPPDFLPYVGAQADDTLRCEDCGGYTVYASALGIVGRFCSCPYDLEHP